MKTPDHMTRPILRLSPKRALLLLTLCLLSACQSMVTPGDPLPSWREGPRKQAILDFVHAVTDTASSDYVEPADRIAVFDNDGTLWAEKPLYFQLIFILDRIRTLAPQHPEWKRTEPFRSALAGDMAALGKQGEKGLMQLMVAAQSGMTTAEFRTIVVDWLDSAEHHRFDRHYTELIYQPMLEVLAWLRANGFETWIVSGGGQEFMRPWAPDIYGIPSQQIIGSMMEVQLDQRDGKPVLVKIPKLHLIDDKEGKVIAIHRFIGKRPIAAFGNSDGDLAMLQWTAAGKGRSLKTLIHHTDATREWAYDRKSPVGRLDKAMDIAKTRHWVLVDMARDWKQVFSFQK